MNRPKFLSKICLGCVGHISLRRRAILMSAEDFRTRPIGAQQTDDSSIERGVVSAIFDDRQSAQAAITELRQIGIPAEDISLVSRNDDNGSMAPSAGDANIDTPIVLEYEVPPDEPLGGSRQLGLK